MKYNFIQSLLTYTIIFVLCFFGANKYASAQSSASAKSWVGTWSCAQQLVETNNNPPSPGLTNNSLRQVVRVSIGGDTIRLRLSNTFGTAAVTMKSVQIALSTGGNSINAATNKQLKFNGNAQVTMNAGAMVTSDPIAFEMKPRADVAITINFGATSSSITGHPGSRTTSYLISGSGTDFSSATKTEHWYNIFGIDVLAPENSACVAILGNSITDGRGSTTDMQNRWPDILSERLVANQEYKQVGVLNLGIGGNNVLKDGLGPSGASRFERDILNQPGVRLAIIGEGVNDIGSVNSTATSTSIANALIAAFQKMIDAAHAKNIKVFGATIMPFKGNSYYNQYSETCRTKVNEWIRATGHFDAVIDFDKVMRSASDPLSLVSTFQNDGLHPDAAGYKKMGESIDLTLFKGFAPVVSGTEKESTELDTHGLLQNFPNPFLEQTSIGFYLYNPSLVSMKVYTIFGEEITEMAGKEYGSGMHTLQFNRNELSNGIYYYTIKTNKYSASKKMILMAR